MSELIPQKEGGKNKSPVLPAGLKNFLIDIDGTVGEDIPNEEPWRMADAEVFQDAIRKCNEWFDAGHRIHFFTSRTEAQREVTTMWLDKNGFKYHGIIFGKPRGGNYIWIDDHPVQTIRFEGKFTDFEEAQGTIHVFKKNA